MFLAFPASKLLPPALPEVTLTKSIAYRKVNLSLYQQQNMIVPEATHTIHPLMYTPLP